MTSLQERRKKWLAVFDDAKQRRRGGLISFPLRYFLQLIFLRKETKEQNVSYFIVV